jgi:hypothetical protein
VVISEDWPGVMSVGFAPGSAGIAEGGVGAFMAGGCACISVVSGLCASAGLMPNNMATAVVVRKRVMVLSFRRLATKGAGTNRSRTACGNNAGARAIVPDLHARDVNLYTE